MLYHFIVEVNKSLPKATLLQLYQSIHFIGS